MADAPHLPPLLTPASLHRLNSLGKDPGYVVLRDSLCKSCIVEGQVVNLRRLSKKRIFFLDLQLLPSTPLPSLYASSSSSSSSSSNSSSLSIEDSTECPCCQYLPGLFRFDEVSLATLQTCYHRSRVGDIVRISGFLELEPTGAASVSAPLPVIPTSILRRLSLVNEDVPSSPAQPAPLTHPPAFPTPESTDRKVPQPASASPTPLLPPIVKPEMSASTSPISGGPSLSSQPTPRFILHGLDLTVIQRWDRDTQGEFIPVHVVRHNVTKQKRQCDIEGDPELCKFWVNTGRCDKGETCEFVHMKDEEEMRRARREWVEKRTRLRQLIAHDPAGQHPVFSKKSRHQRASIFASFLVDKFGIPFLNSGSGVLDVAGGKGDVGLELARRFGIRCTLVEPRKDVWEESEEGYMFRNKKNGKEVKFKKDRKHKYQHGRDSDPLKEKPDDPLVPPSSLFTHINTILPPLDDPDFPPPDPPLVDALRTCSILIGLHPDAATDSIVDHALAHHKPFAVIPCCVFKRAGERRRQWIEENVDREVATYEDLCEYLCWKVRTVSGNTRTVRREWVGFVGRNTVLLGKVNGGTRTEGCPF